MTEIVLVESCELCGESTLLVYEQPALFIHGGYGEATRHEVKVCACGTVRVFEKATK